MESESGKQIFRESSLKRAASPEELDGYIRVTSPGVWLVIGCIIFFLLGILVWGYFGSLETKMTMYGKTVDGVFTGYVKATDLKKLETGMEVSYQDRKGVIAKLSPYPVPADDVIPDELWDTFKVEKDTPLYPVTCTITLTGGGHQVEVLLEDIKPMDLLFD